MSSRRHPRPVGRPALLAGLAALAGVLLGLAGATPARAHGADAPDGTNYRTELSGLTPAVPGLVLRTVEAGGRLELTNRTGRTIEVLGYQGEPYLEIRPDGVYENLHSPATYLNVSLTGGTAPPATANPALPPQWRRVSDEPVARWHDHRTHWMSGTAPPQVTADPSRPHRIRDWTVPLRDGVATHTARGTLDWLPPPSAPLWWALAGLLALGCAGLGLLSLRRRAVAAALGGLAIAGGAAAVGYAVARELDAGAAGAGAVAVGLLAGQLWPVLTGLGALAAGGYALAGRPAGDFAVALAGACLAAFAGLPHVAVLGRSVAPVPWPGWVARLVVAAVVGVGVGLAAAGVLRLRAASHEAAAATPPPGARADGSAAAPG